MIKRALAIFFLVSLCMFGYDTPQFYKARHFQGEPRFEKSGLITVDISSTGGKTSHAYNQCGNKIYLLDDLPLKLKDKLTSIDDFEKQRIQGEFSFFELAFNTYIGFPKGIFAQIYAPFRSLRIDAYSPHYAPLISPLQELLLPKKIRHNGLADITTLIGLSRNYQDTEVLDFLDIELKAGVIWPTSKAANQAIFFDIPLGYNGHFAFPISCAASIGIFEWLTCGVYGQAMGFSSRSQDSVLKKRGPLLSAATYIKADHILGGFSLLCNYSYDRQQHKSSENSYINNYKQWSMQTIQTSAEYDFNEEGRFCGARILLKYEAIVTGKNIFKTSLFGGSLGLDFSCDF